VNLNTSGKFAAAATLALGQAFTLAQAANTIEVTTGGTTLTLNGLISNTSATPAGLVQDCAGVLELTNSGNTFGGPTALIDVQVGTLQVSSWGSAGRF